MKNLNLSSRMSEENQSTKMMKKTKVWKAEELLSGIQTSHL